MTLHRILFLSSFFPPDVRGGAEASAAAVAHYFASLGHECAVLTTAKAKNEELDGGFVNGIRTWRSYMPRSYPAYNFDKQASWKKPIWHLQDHVDRRNRGVLARVLEEFQPEYIQIHMLQGIGYNALAEISRRDIPTLFVLHDLGLVCVRMSMFKNGSNCARQCLVCRLSTIYKSRLISRIHRLGFCSPSRANLDNLGKFFEPLSRYPNAVILNAIRYPRPQVVRSESARVRFLYVGRLHPTKGVNLLLQAASSLRNRYRFSMTVIGTGPMETELTSRYASEDWCRFTGFIDQESISNYMANSDAMCIPSIWLENSPGVVVHALSLGLPVIGSNKGGIPELIRHRQTGLLVPAGDPSAWVDALEEVLQNPNLLIEWRRRALEDTARFDQAALGSEVMSFMEALA